MYIIVDDEPFTFEKVLIDIEPDWNILGTQFNGTWAKFNETWPKFKIILVS